MAYPNDAPWWADLPIAPADPEEGPEFEDEDEEDPDLALDTYTAVGLAEGFIEAESEEQVIQAWQHLIDTGTVWSLQGWFGRTAADLIEAGICTRKAGE